MNSALFFDEHEVRRALGSYLGRAMPLTNPEWLSLIARERAQRNIALRYWWSRLFGWAMAQRAGKKPAEKDYEKIWASADITELCDPTKNQMPHQWRQEGFLLNSSVLQKLHLALMIKAMRSVRPSSVLEVGSGWGLNLLVLSCQCPETRFQGVELTRAGVELTRSLAAAEKLPEPVSHIMPEPPKDPTGYRRITVEQGSAERLPHPDASFDLVMTRLALEQMENIRDAALSEIARVARSHVLMIESFREMNDEGIRRKYAVGSNYFRGRLADLPRYGLEPIFTFSDWPHKITLKPVFVLAKKTNAIPFEHPR
jgi:SAM-dependent methyltransferase